MTNHFPLGRLAETLRRDGFTVDILDGAQGRSARRFTNGYYVGCQASVAHHTGSSGSNPAGDIAYILNGKGEGFVIANAYVARDGRITLIASGPTYTEGSGGPLGIIPENRANDVCFSVEIAGGLTPFPAAQQHAALLLHVRANQIAADVWDWPDDPFAAHRLFAHHEWAPDRKIDPAGRSAWAGDSEQWDMEHFRRDARAVAREDNEMVPVPGGPRRAYDSRPAEQGAVYPPLAWANGGVPKKPFGPKESRQIVVDENGSSTKAEVNVTVIGLANGYVEVGPTDFNGKSNTSLVNIAKSQVNSNTGIVEVVDGRIWVYAHDRCDIAVDVRGLG